MMRFAPQSSVPPCFMLSPSQPKNLMILFIISINKFNKYLWFSFLVICCILALVVGIYGSVCFGTLWYILIPLGYFGVLLVMVLVSLDIWQISGMARLCELVASQCQQGQGGAEGQFPVGSFHSPLHYLEVSPALDLRQIWPHGGQICVRPQADLGEATTDLGEATLLPIWGRQHFCISM